MLKVEKAEVFNLHGAIRGMRAPMQSWDKSDSRWETISDYQVGESDLALMRKLYRAGTEHRKYLRQIFVCMDITAPLLWWKEFDTYKVGTVANSCSTMHTIHRQPLTRDDFSIERMNNTSLEYLDSLIAYLNECSEMYVETKAKAYWQQIIDLLPESYMQKRTVTMNYENVVTIIRQRKGHKLSEWSQLIAALCSLPYVKEIIEYALD